MEQKFVQEIKSKLLDEQRQILEMLGQKKSDLSQISGEENLTDYTDIASSLTDQQLIEAIGKKSLTRLKQIQSALLRIEQGEYGRCITCRKEISRERLQAIPYALKCINCQTNDEKRK